MSKRRFKGIGVAYWVLYMFFATNVATSIVLAWPDFLMLLGIPFLALFAGLAIVQGQRLSAMEAQLTDVAAIVYISGRPRMTIPLEKGTKVDVKHESHPTHEHRRWIKAVTLSRKGNGKLVMSERDGWTDGDLFLVWRHIYDLRKEVRFSYTPEARRLLELTRT